MPAPLYTTENGFNRSEIMRRAWELFRNGKAARAKLRDVFGEDTPERLALAWKNALRNAWKEAKDQRHAVQLAERTPEQIAADTAALAAQVNALGCDTFRRAA